MSENRFQMADDRGQLSEYQVYLTEKIRYWFVSSNQISAFVKTQPKPATAGILISIFGIPTSVFRPLPSVLNETAVP